MRSSRLAALAAFPLIAAAPAARVAAHAPPALTIHVESMNGGAPVLIVASAGTIQSNGKTYQAKSDTLRLSGPADLTTSDPVMIASFIGDHEHFVRVSVRENGGETQWGTGELIVVSRTPLGSRLEAMALQSAR